MKKIFSLFLFLIMVSISFVLVGCKANRAQIQDNISDIRYGIYDAKNDMAKATYVYGERENPYKPDGISNPKTSFGIISITFNTKPELEKIDFTLKYGEKTINGQLEKSPFTSEYLADIGEQISSETPLELEIKLNEKTIQLILKKQSTNWEIDSAKALKIGEKALKDEIDEMKRQGKCEYYLKIIADTKSNFGQYFWAFTVISENGTKHTVVFAPNNEQILVKN